ncbi:hypothetical protein K461DRAFT_278465 [Myriangium duriaei CBS 260.36]|uniref:Rhodopsin domain-containing protein n=1 Tax=Myriangium duriaei CBS 260.36 TaxID=1168546 RepID=A0A9P4J4K1_9PEZI|nr:hypothetical protein K461DRAFT_278465 [Myriangium duriaei CBS 260.36]
MTAVSAATLANAGYHINEYTPQQLETYFKIVFASNLLYNVSLTLSKMSVLLLYRRIFTVRSFEIMFWIVTSIVLSEFFVSEFGLIFATKPIEAQWKFWLPHTSIDNKKFWLATAIINILLDVIILAMPQTRVWKLHQKKKSKLLLSVIFLMGAFVTLVSIVRIVEFETVNISDLTYTLTTPGIWTMMEMDMWIICACLPTLPNLVRHWRDSIKGRNAQRGGSTPSKIRLWFRSSRKPDTGRGFSDLESSGLPYILPTTVGAAASHEDTTPLTGIAETYSMNMRNLDPVSIRKEYNVYRETVHADNRPGHQSYAGRAQ